jgi:hypothetical protein
MEVEGEEEERKIVVMVETLLVLWGESYDF